MDIKFPKALKKLDDPYRYKIIYGGRGSGKSWTIARKLILRAVQGKIRVLCARQLQNSISESVHKLLTDQIYKMGLEGLFTITQKSITSVNGSEFIFKGIAHNTAEIKSLEGIDIIWVEEGESLTEASWNIIDPTIRKEGSEIWVSFNTRFKFDFLYRYFVVETPLASSLVIKINYDDNPFFPDVLRKQMEHMKVADYENYLHIWCGELKQIADGAIFGKQILKMKNDCRQISIPIQSNCPVDTFWDIGKSDQTSIWFMQRVGNEYRLIDFYEARLEEVEHYTKLIKSKDYLYGVHYLPHDADHEKLGMVRNIKKQLEDGGVRPTSIVPRIPHKNTAIEMTREMFTKCYFHDGDDERGRSIETGLEHLSAYKYKYNDGDDVYRLTPHHDVHSNAADAFQQIAQAKFLDTNDKYSDWGNPING